jgi:hypothetical protein
MHTTVSDGTDTPEEIVYKVREAGVELFSVTDHDAISAGRSIPMILGEIGSDFGLSFIRGVEFSCEDEMGKYHILGYGYDPDIPGIDETVEEGHHLRIEKVRARIQFLKERYGFTFPQDQIDRLFALDNPGKPHIARMMIEHGYASDIKDAFKNYLNKKKFAINHIRPEVAIEGIVKSGGIPVVAHPFFGDGDELITGEDMEDRLRHLMDLGIKGVEGFYSGFTPRLCEEILGYAQKYDLYVTAGSDYHGTNKMIEIGWTNAETVPSAPEGLKRFLKDVEII